MLLFFSYKLHFGKEFFGPFDLLVTPVYLILIFVWANLIVYKKAKEKPEYQYFISALFIKLFATIFFCIFYVIYYGGGDTTAYFSGSYILIEMFLKRPDDFFTLYFGEMNFTNKLLFDYDTNWPPYWGDPRAFYLTKLITPLAILGVQRYILTSIVFSTILFFGIWRLFLVFCEKFPYARKEIAFSILFFPSVLFWGSGIIKDSVTFSALGWFIYAINNIFFKFKQIHLNIIFLVISSYLILSIKPYILYALIPGSLIWVFYNKLSSIRGGFFKTVIIILILASSFSLSFYILSNMGEGIMHEFAFDTVLQKAQINQSDLIREEEYGSNYFNLGTFDPTFAGIISKLPIAVISCLFRPFIWEVNGAAMLLSGLENTLLLYLFLYLIYKSGFVRIIKKILNEPILLFSMCFIIIFSFGVGLSTPNFGALVRYRLPAVPLFVVTLFLLKKNISLKAL